MAPSNHSFPPVRACLFDMDGLLLNTEDIYTLVVNTILAEHGRPALPWSLKARLQGRPAPAADAIFQEWAQLPLTLAEYAASQAVLQAQLFPSARPLPGIPELLSNLQRAGVHLALATSSHRTSYGLKTAHLRPLFGVFPPRQQVLGDDPRIPPGGGKPAPHIYLLALETVNEGCRERGEREVRPEECLVFEDSVLGVEAGRRAGMRVVWCPHPALAVEYRGQEAEVLAGMTGEGAELGGAVAEAAGDGARRGWPGEVGDGWGELLETLDGFPYARYGFVVPE
jgi:pseudouridine-5'-monophosphatase